MDMLERMTQKEVMEQTLFHLLYQSRQIDHRYGLMMKEELSALYQKRDKGMHLSEEWIEQQQM
jgi:hypothetical protein